MGDFRFYCFCLHISNSKKIERIMKDLIIVFTGGGLGSSLRYLLNSIPVLNIYKYPLTTSMSNILGCLVLGLVMGQLIKNNQINSTTSLLFGTGFCGGLTTFSAFAYENIEFIKTGNFIESIIYTSVSISLGFLSIYVGLQLAK